MLDILVAYYNILNDISSWFITVNYIHQCRRSQLAMNFHANAIAPVMPENKLSSAVYSNFVHSSWKHYIGRSTPEAVWTHQRTQGTETKFTILWLVVTTEHRVEITHTHKQKKIFEVIGTNLKTHLQNVILALSSTGLTMTVNRQLAVEVTSIVTIAHHVPLLRIVWLIWTHTALSTFVQPRHLFKLVVVLFITSQCFVPNNAPSSFPACSLFWHPNSHTPAKKKHRAGGLVVRVIDFEKWSHIFDCSSLTVKTAKPVRRYGLSVNFQLKNVVCSIQSILNWVCAEITGICVWLLHYFSRKQKSTPETCKY